jgi:hypothetical protein
LGDVGAEEAVAGRVVDDRAVAADRDAAAEHRDQHPEGRDRDAGEAEGDDRRAH